MQNKNNNNKQKQSKRKKQIYMSFFNISFLFFEISQF